MISIILMIDYFVFSTAQALLNDSHNISINWALINDWLRILPWNAFYWFGENLSICWFFFQMSWTFWISFCYRFHNTDHLVHEVHSLSAYLKIKLAFLIFLKAFYSQKVKLFSLHLRYAKSKVTDSFKIDILSPLLHTTYAVNGSLSGSSMLFGFTMTLNGQLFDESALKVNWSVIQFL